MTCFLAMPNLALFMIGVGKYVPEAIAEQLIMDEAALSSQRSHGTALVMDIAGFTAFSAQHEPELVVETLDNFLMGATHAISISGGIVLTYLGDGCLAKFNASISIAKPERKALGAAKTLLNATGLTSVLASQTLT